MRTTKGGNTVTSYSLTTLLCMLRLLRGKMLLWEYWFGCLGGRRVEQEAVTVIPKSLRGSDLERREKDVLEEFWIKRRQDR